MKWKFSFCLFARRLTYDTIIIGENFMMNMLGVMLILLGAQVSAAGHAEEWSEEALASEIALVQGRLDKERDCLVKSVGLNSYAFAEKVCQVKALKAQLQDLQNAERVIEERKKTEGLVFVPVEPKWSSGDESILDEDECSTEELKGCDFVNPECSADEKSCENLQV